MTSTSATSSPSQIHQNVVPSEVGWQFVPQYYTLLTSSPIVCIASTPKSPPSFMVPRVRMSRHALVSRKSSNKITSLGFDDCKVYIHSVDAQSSANGGIIIQVIGEMSNHGDPWRKFVQTFFLAEQPNGYFVLNDIFRFLKEETVEDDASEQEASSTTSSDSAPESVREPTPPPPAPQPPKPAPKPAAPKTWASLAATDSKRWGAQVTTESKGMSEVLASAASPAPALAPVSDALSPTPRRKHPAIAVANALATSECFDFRVEPLQPPAQPAAPKTWASLAAAHSKRWGAQVATESIEMSEVSGAPSPIPRREHPAIAAANAVATPQCFVKGVTEVVSQQQLRTLLGRFGTVKDVEIVRTKDCAFLEFNSLDAAKEAIIASLPMDAGGEGGLRLDSPEGSTRIIVQTRMVSINRPWGGAPNGEDWGGAPNSETWGSVIRSRRRPRGRRGSPPPKQ
ncbi:hypothetical protein DFH29DRAFT_881762 [Suillus ampliporus]|nr:hypothetical protein DFH29DRAFT_881762 [Suillus ampliporus]